MTAALQRMRALAVSSSLFPPTSLGKAVAALGFVQADPIRSPAQPRRGS